MYPWLSRPTRRSLLAAAAATGASSVLPAARGWASEGSGTDEIQPFCIDVPEDARRSSQTDCGDSLARAGDGLRSIPRRAARDGSGARALLGDRLRLAQG